MTHFNRYFNPKLVLRHCLGHCHHGHVGSIIGVRHLDISRLTSCLQTNEDLCQLPVDEVYQL